MLAPWKKSYDKPREHILLTKVRVIKALVFPVVMYRCEGGNIRLNTEELMLLNCSVGEDSWESLEVQGDPTSQFNKKSILNIHWRDWCWGWSSNTLAIWCEENLMLGKSEVRKKRGWQWKRWLDGIIKSMDMSLSILRDMVKDREAWHAEIHGAANNRTWLSDWTELKWIYTHIFTCTEYI